MKSLSPPPGYARFEWPGTSGGEAGFDDVNPAGVGPGLSRSAVEVGVSRTDLAATHVRHRKCRAAEQALQVAALARTSHHLREKTLD